MLRVITEFWNQKQSFLQVDSPPHRLARTARIQNLSLILHFYLEIYSDRGWCLHIAVVTQLRLILKIVKDHLIDETWHVQLIPHSSHYRLLRFTIPFHLFL
jgi:hypothetical protein